MRTFTIHLSDWPIVWYCEASLKEDTMHVWGKDIQVSGFECFEENRWREAILSYLFGVWGNLKGVMYRPKMMFGGITLRLHQSAGEYYAYGPKTHEDPPAVRRLEEHLVLKTWEQPEVEVALARFVKDNGLRQLTLPFRHGELRLWKKSQRGQYGIEAIGLPVSWGVDGPEWQLR